MSNTLAIKSTLPNVTLWKAIDWTSVSAYVEKLQQRIYRAESQGKNRKVRELQRLLMRSKAALLLSIRKVTQINKGKKTAGVDNFTALTDTKRLKLYLQMKEYNISQHKPKPSYRIYIKKKNGKLRPLSIPIIKDRIWQNIAKLALEPKWEYIFEPTSYGFRPGRGCHDAMTRIFKSLARKKKRWIFEGDFKGCFDNLRHDYIMEQIRYFPNKDIIEKWLKSGYIDNNVFNETDRGGGQGSIISPLLANIALHGMEEILGIKYTMRKVKDSECASNITDYSMTRYADDFVIMCKTKEQAESVYTKLQGYLEKRGLELEPTKTRVVEITEGFDFLGFNVRVYQTSQGEKLFIKPSKETIKKSKKKITSKVKELHGANVETLIHVLNPILRGIANYWSPVVAKKAFNNMDAHNYHVTTMFVCRMHSNKGRKWVFQRYYRTDYKGKHKDRWILSSPNEAKVQLIKMSWTPIKRHTMIKHKATPYDSNLKKYFENRKSKNKNLTEGKQVCLSCMF